MQDRQDVKKLRKERRGRKSDKEGKTKSKVRREDKLEMENRKIKDGKTYERRKDVNKLKKRE